MNKASFEDGREAQFQEMMQQLDQLQARYKGVRGELLGKVREELAKLKPGTSAAITAPPAPAPVREASPSLTKMVPATSPPAPPAIRVASASADKMLPSCRMCGRGMRLSDADGSLICDKGHTRPSARSAQNEGVSAHQ